MKMSPDDWKKTRRVAVFLLILFGLAVTLVADIEICNQEVGGDAAIDVCHPLALNDLPSIMYLLLIAALVWPELSELNILGLGLKKDVEAAKSTAHDAKNTANDAKSAAQEAIETAASVSQETTTAREHLEKQIEFGNLVQQFHALYTNTLEEGRKREKQPQLFNDPDMIQLRQFRDDLLAGRRELTAAEVAEAVGRAKGGHAPGRQ